MKRSSQDLDTEELDTEELDTEELDTEELDAEELDAEKVSAMSRLPPPHARRARAPVRRPASLCYVNVQGFCSLVGLITSSGSFATGIAGPSARKSHLSLALPLALTVNG